MNILFISRKFPPSVGGMQLFARDLATALSVDNNVKIIKWGGSNKWLPFVLPTLTIRSFFNLLTSKVDIIHSQDGLLAPIGYLLAKIFRKPYAVVIHGLDITHPNIVYQKFIVPFIRKADRVICISSASKLECIERGVSESKIDVITLAVNDDLYQKSSKQDLANLLEINLDAPILLTVGRLVERKGVAWLVDNVIPELIKLYPSLLYLIVGDGTARAGIEKAINNHQLADNVRLLGKVNSDLLAAAYNGADLFIMPNIKIDGDIEGFGLVSLEAALCQLPVIASNLEGITDAIVNTQNGLLLPSGHKKEYVNEISKMLADETYRREFGQKARKYTLDNYQWSAISAQYNQAYLQLIDQNT